MEGGSLERLVIAPVADHVARETRAGLLSSLTTGLHLNGSTCLATLQLLEPALKGLHGRLVRDLNSTLVPELQRVLLEQMSTSSLGFPTQGLGPAGLTSMPVSPSYTSQAYGGNHTMQLLDQQAASNSMLSGGSLSEGGYGYNPSHQTTMPFPALNSIAASLATTSGLDALGLGLANGLQPPSAEQLLAGDLSSQMSTLGFGSSIANSVASSVALNSTSLSGLRNASAQLGSGLGHGVQPHSMGQDIGFNGMALSARSGVLCPGAGDKFARTPMFGGAPGPAAGHGRVSWSSRPSSDGSGIPFSGHTTTTATAGAPGMPNAGAAKAGNDNGNASMGCAVGSSMGSGNSPALKAISEDGQVMGMVGGRGGSSSGTLLTNAGIDASAVVTTAMGSGHVSGDYDSALNMGYSTTSPTPTANSSSPLVPSAHAMMTRSSHAHASPGTATSPSSSAASSLSNSSHLHHAYAQLQHKQASVGAIAQPTPHAAARGGGGGGPALSMAAKLQQAAVGVTGSSAGAQVTPTHAHGAGGAMAAVNRPGAAKALAQAAALASRAPSDIPPRFRVLPPAVQAKIYTLTKDNHVVLLKDFDDKVVSKLCVLTDKFGPSEALIMLERIEEVLKGKAGRLANGPGYLDVSVSTRLDELKQRAAGQVSGAEDMARATLHARIYSELKSLVEGHAALGWQYVDQGTIVALRRMPNNVALERLSDLRYHSFKPGENVKATIAAALAGKASAK